MIKLFHARTGIITFIFLVFLSIVISGCTPSQTQEEHDAEIKTLANEMKKDPEYQKHEKEMNDAEKNLTPHLGEEKAYFEQRFPNSGRIHEGVLVDLDPKKPIMRVSVCMYTVNDYTEDLIAEAKHYLPAILNAPYPANTVVQLMYGSDITDNAAYIKVHYLNDGKHEAYLEMPSKKTYNLEK